MNKILLILRREYLTRVTRRSFIVMSIVGPLVLAGIFVVPLWLQKFESEQVKRIAVVDESMILSATLKTAGNVTFTTLENTTLEQAQKSYAQAGYYAVLFIPKNVLNSRAVQVFSNRQPDFGLKLYISKVLEKDLESLKLLKYKISPDILRSVQTPINVQTIKWTPTGQEQEVTMEIKVIIGTVSAILIYIFIFMFSVQVMRGVIEEKVNRIVEVVISSVKPIQLMVGKITGIMAVGLSQFLLWVIITFSVVWLAQVVVFPEPAVPTADNPTATLNSGVITQVKALGQDDYRYALDVFASVSNVSWGVTIGSFLFFFIFGYLLYASIFAAVGAAVDSETDTQQFMIPITAPLFLSILMIQVILFNPDGPIAFWMSMIPFTSPIIMMARIPFGVPYWEVILSAFILISTVIVMSLLASKVYKTGILMYGKKATLKEIFRWMRY